LSVSAVSAHEATFGMMIWRRHLPTCMTSGMLAPTGTSERTNLPFGSVNAVTMGLPDTLAPPHESHTGPCLIGSSGVLGM
jgi:hypothetical protein